MCPSRILVCPPFLFFFVSVCSLSLQDLFLPFDAVAWLSVLSLPPHRYRPLSTFSLQCLHSHLCGLSLATAYSTTLDLIMALLVGADDLFITWHACLNLSSCRTSLAFVLRRQYCNLPIPSRRNDGSLRRYKNPIENKVSRYWPRKLEREGISWEVVVHLSCQ